MAEAAACDPGMKQLTTGTNQELWNFISQLSRKSAAPLQSKTQSSDLWVYYMLLKCFSIIHASDIVTPHKVTWSGRTIIKLNWEYPEPHSAKNIPAGELLFLKLTLTLCFYLEHLGPAREHPWGEHKLKAVNAQSFWGCFAPCKERSWTERQQETVVHILLLKMSGLKGRDWRFCMGWASDGAKPVYPIIRVTLKKSVKHFRTDFFFVRFFN